MYRLKGFLATLILLMILTAGCVRNEFTVKVQLPADVNRTYRTLYYASDSKKGWVIEGVLQVTGGASELKLITRNPTIVYVFDGSQYPSMFFYAERGNSIKISGTSANPREWSITGNEINEALSDWRRRNLKILDKTSGGKGSKELNEAVMRYVKSNPDNPVSTLLLLEYFDRGLDEEGFLRCRTMLKGEAAKGKWTELVARNDMIEEEEEFRLPPSIVLNTVATGCDTVTFGRVPVLLSFNRSWSQGYRDRVDRLRDLSRSSGDSSRRIIANILLDGDSVQRWQRARVDSLQGVIEGWMPLGLSDSVMRRLGVKRLPFVIVVDSKGRVSYRGTNLEDAAAEFSKLK